MRRQNPQDGRTLSHFVFLPRHNVHAVTERLRGYVLSTLCRFRGGMSCRGGGGGDPTMIEAIPIGSTNYILKC